MQFAAWTTNTLGNHLRNLTSVVKRSVDSVQNIARISRKTAVKQDRGDRHRQTVGSGYCAAVLSTEGRGQKAIEATTTRSEMVATKHHHADAAQRPDAGRRL